MQTVLLSVLAAAGTWLTVRDQSLRRQVAAVVAVGLVMVPVIAWYSGYWPMMAWFADSGVSVMGYPPLSFPISTVSSYNPVLDEFACRVVLGWPDGLALFQFPWEHADADFSRIQRTFCQGVLGAWDALAFSLAAVAFISLGWRRTSAAIGAVGAVEDPALKRRMIAGAALQSILSVTSLLWAKVIFEPTVVVSMAAPIVAVLFLSELAALNLLGVAGLYLAVAWFAWCSEAQKNRRRFIITGAVGLIVAGFLPGLVILISTSRSPSKAQ